MRRVLASHLTLLVLLLRELKVNVEQRVRGGGGATPPAEEPPKEGSMEGSGGGEAAVEVA